MLVVYLNIIDEQNDKNKFEKLYLKYRSKMYYVAMSVLHHQQDAEDALHNAFLAIAKNIKKIKDVDSNETAVYLFRTAKNSALNVYAKKKRQAEHEIGIVEFIDINQNDIRDEELISEAQKLYFEKVVSCIEMLPEHYRIVLELHFQHEYTIPQIAKILGLKLSTVKQQLVRGKKMLLSQLRSEEYEIK